jgi:uncharacterized protein (UPF0332 family)
VTLPPEAVVYIRKAERALAAARLLLASGDPEGACNRAYYAMFHAAHAALRVVRTDAPDAVYKSHHSLIAAFGRHVILSANMDPAWGRALNQVQQSRALADYVGDPLSLDNGTWAVTQAEAFVAAMRAVLINLDE